MAAALTGVACAAGGDGSPESGTGGEGTNPTGTGGATTPGTGGNGIAPGTGGTIVGGGMGGMIAGGGTGGMIAGGGMGGMIAGGGTGGMIVGGGMGGRLGPGMGGRTGGVGGAGAGMGGMMAGGMGGMGAPGGSGVASTEDTGADCTVAALPAASGLPAVTLLPDPFTKLDGTRMTTKAEWRCRREEIRKQVEKYAMGTKPDAPTSVTGTVSNTSITVNVTANGKSAMFTATITLPTTGSAPYPAIIGYGGSSPLDSGVINSEGVAVINYNPIGVGAEGNGHGANQTGTFYSLYPGGSQTGLLVAWGWGVSRIIDVIEKSGSTIIKPDAIGVTGCSRYGKGAFIAGAFDQRIALTLPVESGTAGVPIWRGIAKADKGENGNPSQSLANAYGEQPWFADAFNTFTNAATKAPIDTHEIVAMIAPRGLFIMDNPHIGELSPKYGHVAAIAGAEVYNALGANGNVSYISAVQDGMHCDPAGRPEWVTPLRDNIQKFLKKTGNAAGVIKAAANYTGNLADWRSWTTPTLN